MLAANPHVQQKLYDEVSNVVGDRTAEYNDFQNLIMCRCTIKETLRFFPAVPSIPKVPIEDVTLGGQKVKKGV